MRTVGLVTDTRFRLHEPGPGHPECPERLSVLETLFEQERHRIHPRVAARACSEEEAGRIHAPALLHGIAASAARPFTQFDGDTSASTGSFDAARLAAGGAIEMADHILAGAVDHGFVASRPPGHHAEADQVMGFCLLNNIAIVARHLQADRDISRVLVLDWDVHHGNGTQHTFYDDPSVMYASLHQYPFYPGSGGPGEIGEGEGAGTTVNVPMAPGCKDADYVAAFREILLPIAREFAPEFILVSAGFDAHISDPLGGMHLSTSAYTMMTDALVGLADDVCDGRLMMTLEGGYNLEGLRDSVDAALMAMRDPGEFDDGEGELSDLGCAAKEALRGYWNM